MTTEIKGVKLTLAAAICWENYMPLLRFSLYSQNVNLYLAPTADARDTWLPLMRTIAFESRAYVLSANQCVKRKHLPDWITGKQTDSTSPATSNASGSQNPAKGSVKEAPELTKVPTDDEAGSQLVQSTSLNAPGNHELALPSETTSKGPSSTYIDPSGEEFVCRGGSCIVGPDGTVLAGPLWEEEEGGLLSVKVDFEDCERGRLDLDVAGSYGRGDAFRLQVEGLDISPPP